MQHRRRALLHNSAHCEKMRRKQHGTIPGDASENICRLLPKYWYGIGICQLSDDGNPSTFNVFRPRSPVSGILIISAVVILRHIIKAEKGEKEPVSIRLLRRHR